MNKYLQPNFLYAVALLVGTIVGAGIFGIPFAFVKGGFGLGLFFLVLVTAIIFLINLVYGEIVLRTRRVHFLIGYANIYLGSFARYVALFVSVAAIYASLLAYIILAGGFLSNFIDRFDPSTMSIGFFVIASGIVLSGLKRVAWVELVMLVFFSAIVVIITVIGVPELELSNYELFHKEFWFLPYGVLLFALGGMSAISLQRELLMGDNDGMRKAITIGTFIPVVLYAVFAFIVVGVSGDVTSPDAISGLVGFLGDKIIIVASLFGLLAISTSFMSLSTILLESFMYDFGIKRFWAWTLVEFVPFLLFIAGVLNFIEIISFTGAFSSGIMGILVILIYQKARTNGDRVPEYALRVPMWVLYIVGVLFSLGSVYAFLS